MMPVNDISKGGNFKPSTSYIQLRAMRAGHCISSFHEGRCFRNFQICWIHVKKLLVHIRVVLKNAIFKFGAQIAQLTTLIALFFFVLRVSNTHTQGQP